MSPEELNRRLTAAKLVAFDTETSGLDWRSNFICGYVFTFGPNDSHYIPVHHASNNAPYDPGIYLNIIKEAALRRDLNWIMHNAAFDLMFCARIDIHFLGSIFDTMVLAPLINEFEPSFSLDALSRVYDCEVQKATNIYEYMANHFGREKATKSIMSRFWEMPGADPHVVDYATKDGEATWHLYHKLIEKISELELTKCWEVEWQLTSVLHRMRWRGFKVDLNQLETILVQARNRMIDAENGLPYKLNSKSPIEMEKLFSDSGIKDWPLTETGRASFPRHWLIGTPLGRKVVEAREWRTLCSTFIEPLIAQHVWNGRVHAEYHQLRNDQYGTISGRLSSAKPNMQNMVSVERHPEQGRLLRSVFVPDDGLTLWNADYSQCEVRLAAHYSKIERWIAGYNADPPIDAHSVVAQMCGRPRIQAKTINLAIMLGAGRAKIAQQLGMTEEESNVFVDQYFETFPEIKALQKRATNAFAQRGYIKSVLGRRFQLEDESLAYRALSRVLQGSNADIVKLALVEVDKIQDVELLNTVHDSIVFQCVGDSGYKAVKYAMVNRINDEFDFKAPMAVDFKASARSWGDV